MLAPEFKIEDDFPAVSYEQWRALAEADLKGAAFDQKLVSHTHEGIDIQPLYTQPRSVGFWRGIEGSWPPANKSRFGVWRDERKRLGSATGTCTSRFESGEPGDS